VIALMDTIILEFDQWAFHVSACSIHSAAAPAFTEANLHVADIVVRLSISERSSDSAYCA